MKSFPVLCVPTVFECYEYLILFALWSTYVVLCLCVCSLGVWKVVAKFHSNPQQSFSAEFEVKEYGKSLIPFDIKAIKLWNPFDSVEWTFSMFCTFSVLPSFEVKLIPTSPFFYVDSQEFTVAIKATYVKVFLKGTNRSNVTGRQ